VERLGARATVIGTDKTYREMINALQASEANTIVAMPIPLLSFARYMKAERVKINLTGVLVSADTCTPEVEAMLREELDCEIYPHYGSRESGLGGAITCPAHAGMHLWESDLYVEIIDEAGNVLPVGSQGEIVLTTLRRQAMPLIRYRTGDVGVIYAEECSCGSIVRRLKNPRRRNILVLDIADADSVMFSHKQLLDYRIALSAEGCSLEAVIVKPIDEVELKKSLAGLLPDDMVLKMSVRRYNAKEERPFFSKKRVIL
jgi:phenylacetate-coenzyme A ligase PaaK-like adenylate-forming protein